MNFLNIDFWEGFEKLKFILLVLHYTILRYIILNTNKQLLQAEGLTII